MNKSLALLVYILFCFSLGASEFEKLVEQIRYHDHIYWNENRQEISDYEYDLLKKRLKSLDPSHPLIISANETPILGLRVRHTRPMLSLEKAYSFAELNQWISKRSRSNSELFLVQPKYDGISISYNNGVMVTRGDGEFGALLRIPDHSLVVLSSRHSFRGELILTKDHFHKLNHSRIERGDKPYKTARSAVAALVSLFQNRAEVGLNVTLTLIDHDYITKTVQSQFSASLWQSFSDKYTVLPYPLDGIVVKIADSDYYKELGYTKHHPQGAIAFKWESERKTSTIRSVEWRCGKSKITPVAVFDPILFGSVKVGRASLHSYGYFRDNNCMIGDKITVEYKGRVIPKIVDIETGEYRSDASISDCPTCGDSVVIIGRNLVCTNRSCPAILSYEIVELLKKNGCRGIGQKTMIKVIRLLGMKSLDDVKKIAAQEKLLRHHFNKNIVASLLDAVSK